MARKPKQRANGTGSIYLRSGSKIWQMAFRVNGNVVRESTGETSKKKAEDKLKQRLAEIQTGTFCGPQFERTLVAELAEDFIRDYRINGRKSLDDVEARWQLHLKPFFGLMKASEVTKDTLRRYVDHRLKQEASNATINRELAALKRMFNLGLGDKVARVPKFPRLQERNVRTGFVRTLITPNSLKRARKKVCGSVHYSRRVTGSDGEYLSFSDCQLPRSIF